MILNDKCLKNVEKKSILSACIEHYDVIHIKMHYYIYRYPLHELIPFIGYCCL